MRAVVLLVCFGLAATARAQPGQPIRVNIACENSGRTKACSAFLVSFLESNKLFLSAPRADADVILYANANEIALVDRIHLRFVSQMPNTPPVIELDVDIDTRADDDTQRAQLEPAFLRGIALYVGTRHPKAVTVAIEAPADMAVAKPKTTPYGFELDLGGNGNYTENYQSYSGFASVGVSRVTPRDKGEFSVFANGGLNRQPPVTVDGKEVSLDTKQWHIGAGGGWGWLWNRCYAIGGVTNLSKDDDKGQFAYNSTTKLGIEWDHFKPDDPRGNKLAIAYFVGYTAERYNVPNELHETFAQYPTHEVVAVGQVRKDKISLGLSLTARAEVIHPRRRYTLSASPNVEIQIGGHVDINFGFSIAKRELPGPDLDAIDPSDYEQLSRLSYADPLQINGFFNVRLHWDRTNGARNDRFDNL